MATAVMRGRLSPDSGCQGIAADRACHRPRREPKGATGVHEPVRRLSSRQFVIVAGALAAALAGVGVGAHTRPAAPAGGGTLGPRMDFDLATHPAPPASPPPASPTRLLAARNAAARSG
jgi:hypothetical protein